LDTDTAVSSGRPVVGDRRPAAGPAALPVSIATSFLWPGLAQLRQGRPRVGLILAVPQAVLVAGGACALVLGSGAVLGWLLNPSVLLGILALDAVILATRLYAMADSYIQLRRGRSAVVRVASGILLVALVAVSVGAHGVGGQVTWGAYDTLTTVFSPSGPQGGAFSDQPSPTAVASPTPRATVVVATPTPTPTPEPTPSPTPRPDWLADGRLNLLLVGADAGPGRWKLRTDTMILLTVDANTGRGALIGIPRNLRFVPVPPPLDAAFPSGFTDLLNALWVYVEETPGSYPGDPAIAPFAALQDTVGLLTGLHVDAMAVAELQGFVRAVDALGGLDITVPAAVYDRQYPAPDGTGNVELYIPAGAQHLDGWHALAYARTRHQDSDYQRMERQQTVLVALQRQLRCNLVAELPDLLTIARDTLWTNLPLDELPGVVDLGRRVDPDRIVRLTLTPPAFAANLDPASVDAIRAAVADVLAGPEPTPDPSASAEPDDGCGPGG
jgi:LCP family protein required for cell wall assembly